jgi:2-polyprenyl-3-methyl-5-hydroxy-6-metoxy-1,4-benzoquinol methylase
MESEEKPWFESWFNTPYYHILYKERDMNEAQAFLKRLTVYLKLDTHSKVLDVACGKGRHSLFLNELGFDVTGIDLASKSIDHARHYENARLHFYCHDMRKVFCVNYFEVVVNLFTSLGYFQKTSDNLLALKSMASNLKPGGVILVDFFNETWVRNSLVPTMEKEVDGIVFKIQKIIEKDKVIKTIRFEDKGKHYQFTEEVSLLGFEDFENMLKHIGLSIESCFGSYSLDAFDKQTSERLILVGRKK